MSNELKAITEKLDLIFVKLPINLDGSCVVPLSRDEYQTIRKALTRTPDPLMAELVYELKRADKIIVRLARMVKHYGYSEEIPDLRKDKRKYTLSRLEARKEGE